MCIRGTLEALTHCYIHGPQLDILLKALTCRLEESLVRLVLEAMTSEQRVNVDLLSSHRGRWPTVVKLSRLTRSVTMHSVEEADRAIPFICEANESKFLEPPKSSGKSQICWRRRWLARAATFAHVGMCRAGEHLRLKTLPTLHIGEQRAQPCTTAAEVAKLSQMLLLDTQEATARSIETILYPSVVQHSIVVAQQQLVRRAEQAIE